MNKKNIIVILLLLSLGVLLYIPSLQNQFVSDDVGGILNNSNIASFQSVKDQPLSFLQPLIYFVTYKVFGLNALFFRLPSIIFHVSSSIVLYGILVLIAGFEAAIISSFLFLFHPLLTESVVWISAGSYPRYTFFLLLSFFLYLIGEKKKKVIWYLVSLFSFIMAVFSSEKAIFFPLILLLFIHVRNLAKKDQEKLVPFFLISLLTALPKVFQIQTRIAETTIQYGSQSTVYNNPLVQIPLAISTYLSLIFWPFKLELFHTENSLTLINVLIFFSYLAVTVFFYLKDKKIFFWLGFFIIALLPTLIPIKVASPIAERYAYFASIGIFVSFTLIVMKVLKKDRFKKAGFVLMLVILFALAGRTWLRISDWKNEETLALSGSKISEKKLSNLMNLGNVYVRQRNYHEAVKQYSEAIKIAPTYAKAYNNLGYAYSQIGELNLAVANLERGLQINPNLWEAYDNLAAIYTILQQYDKALIYMKKAINLSKQNNELYIHLGIIYQRKGDKEKAKDAFETVLKFDPNNKQAQAGLDNLR